MTTRAKNKITSVLAVATFITVPTTMALAATGYNDLAEIGVYAMAVILIPYLSLTKNK